MRDLLSQVALSPIQVHDVALCRPLLEKASVLRAGDLLLEGSWLYRRGNTLTYLKGKRRIDVITPLKSNMLAAQEAIQLAEIANKWEAHPSRSHQYIAWCAEH